MQTRALNRLPGTVLGRHQAQPATAHPSDPPADAASGRRTRENLPASSVRPSERGFCVETAEEEHFSVVAPVGELDDATVPDFERALSDAIAAGRSILIDLGRLRFIDSSGLWAITLTQTTCRKRRIGLRLRPGPRQVQSVFEVTGLYDLLPFLPAGA